MTKLLSLAAAIGVSLFCVAATSAMPLAPLEQAQASLTIPVAGGCGPGFHRGPNGGGGARRGGSARCGGNSARRGSSPAGRFVPSLQRVPMLVCLLI